MERHAVTCSVRACANGFNVKSSFTNHISQKQRDFADYRHSSSPSSVFVTGSMDYVEFGELVLILINNDTVHFLVSVYRTKFFPQYHMFSIRKDNKKMECLNISDLMDFYPFRFAIH